MQETVQGIYKRYLGRYFEGCREELMGVTIPLKYLPCNKKQQGGNNRRDRREMAVFVIS
jgi:hypothetical protein